MLLVADVKSAPGYELIVERSSGWLHVPWRELWDYRDLLVLLVQRDFISRYKQTLLGPLWFLLQPVLTTLVFVLVFGRFAGIPTDGIPGPLFYLCGLLAWNYFSQNITTGGATFVNNAHLFSKVYFPRVLVPVSIVVANLVSFALQSVPFVAFAAFYFLSGKQGAATLSWQAFLLPLPLLQIAALSLGVSLWMAASTAKYRDLVHLTAYLTQIWMFATPVIYPLSKVSEAWRWIVWANPMSVPVEAFRICLLGRGTLGPQEIALSLALTAALLISGIALFQRVERTVVDSA
jgi:lipopolysaccharide transport system permease protein